jgi:hypothetical protein
MSLERYIKIRNQIQSIIEYPSVTAYLPKITDADLKNGYIKRCFVQKTNDTESPIIEINQKSFSSLSSKPFYTAVELNWKITGTKEEIKEANFKSIKFASKQLNTIHLYLPNLLQFAKPN